MSNDNTSAGKCPMSWHGAQMDFSNDMSYGDYLGLDQILTAQHPRSPNHNEMLFIVQHQTSELWIKLMLHELHAVRVQIRNNDLPPAFKMLSRVARIMDQLVHAWDVLATMTPSEYTAIRPYLGASSGFQSHQYRELEYLLGNKNAALLSVHESKPAIHATLSDALHTPSIYDEAIMLMARQVWRLMLSACKPTGHNRRHPTNPSKRHGCKSIVRRNSTGLYMSWQKSWWIWKPHSASGASVM
jgi:tryptophan 2,3-dioxygenase